MLFFGESLRMTTRWPIWYCEKSMTTSVRSAMPIFSCETGIGCGMSPPSVAMQISGSPVSRLSS